MAVTNNTKEHVNGLQDLKLYTLADVSQTIGVTTRTLLTYIYDGKLKAVKIAGKWRVSEDNLRKFINGEG